MATGNKKKPLQEVWQCQANRQHTMSHTEVPYLDHLLAQIKKKIKKSRPQANVTQPNTDSKQLWCWGR
ncbi:uncharacterized protein ACA1_337550 [Acanthamoeba castellanii str. Neff]|uniref:Uncharacterized protein n=1 Tax=Acanthamoeba castellanii (strain ATCC 30010 / Neff) TaxID=1257118 RepID=L8GP02_ACACF|nr:uncharacterized protein ACA1_337550 [Acanthamoeba castellanii str. Neff]ELR14700.1 hypothetical protein ACA1_337550 [Acanthamoeba castellanii str. Neff]